MIVEQEFYANRHSIAGVIMKSYKEHGIEHTLMSLFKGSKQKQKKLLKDLEKTEAIQFDLTEKLGKKKIQRYRVLFDLKNEIIDVTPIKNEAQLEFTDYELMEATDDPAKEN